MNNLLEVKFVLDPVFWLFICCALFFVFVVLAVFWVFTLKQKYSNSLISLSSEYASKETSLRQALKVQESIALERLSQFRLSQQGLVDEQKQHRLKSILLAEQTVRSEEQVKAFESELESLRNAKKSLVAEFENISNRLFEEKQSQFSRTSKIQLDGIIQPFQQQLKDFQQRTDLFHQQDAAHRNQLMGQISELQKQSQSIGRDAMNLANALKGNNKFQGSWGEVILVKLLEQSGLVEGREFDVQVSELSAEGRRYQPDVVVRLPGGRDVVIDAKVSLTAYERYVSVASSVEKQGHLKAHLESVKAQIKNLSGKKYEELSGLHSLDFVFLFIPIDMAFMLVSEKSPELLVEAYDRNIIIVSPSSLLTVLRTVQALWQRERQDRNVENIVVSAGKLYDQFVRFLESMEDIGSGLDKANDAYQKSYMRLYRGRGNLIKRTDDLKKLGAKTTKSLSDEAVERAGAESD